MIIVLALTAAMSAANQIYETLPWACRRPIKGFVQVAQIVVYGTGTIVVISMLIDRSPLILLSGFGAMTAVLLLIFKDTLLSLVASVQLTGQDLIRVGDWIEVPNFGADGDVIDIALYTVTVQNWDKTITTIPASITSPRRSTALATHGRHRVSDLYRGAERARAPAADLSLPHVPLRCGFDPALPVDRTRHRHR